MLRMHRLCTQKQNKLGAIQLHMTTLDTGRCSHNGSVGYRFEVANAEQPPIEAQYRDNNESTIRAPCPLLINKASLSYILMVAPLEKMEPPWV